MTWTGGGDGSSWNDPNNWSGGAVPTSADVMKITNGDNPAIIDLGGTDDAHPVIIDSIQGDTGSSLTPITITNGVLELSNGMKNLVPAQIWGWKEEGDTILEQTRDFTIVKDATLRIKKAFSIGNDRNGTCRILVSADGHLYIEDAEISDVFSWITVEDKGFAEIKPSATEMHKGGGAGGMSRSVWENYGMTEYPVGIIQAGDSGGYDSRAGFVIRQHAGEMVLGGNVSRGPFVTNGKKSYLTFEWYGGTIHAIDDVLFDCDAEDKYQSKVLGKTGIYGTSPVTADVDEGKILDLSGLPVLEETVSMTKKGLGTVVMGTTAPAQMSIEKGAIGFSTGSAVQDASWLTFANGTVMYLDNVSAIDTAPNGTPVYAYADYSAIAINSVLISSSDSALLAAIKSSILASGDFPSTLSLEITDGNLVVTSNYTFNHGTIQDLNDPNGWQCGSVPEGEDVSVSGANVTAVLNAQTPAFSSISVVNGATLKVEGEVTLPSLKLSADAKIVICSDAVVLAGAIAPKADETGMSVLEIESGAELHVNESTVYFRDIDLRLNGTIKNMAANANIYFGYAPANEQTMFAMTSDGGKLINGDSASISCVHFMGADAGGVVSLPANREILIKDTTLPETCYKFCEGNGNTEEIPFSIIGTKIKASASTNHKFAGTAKVTFGEGSYFKRSDASNPQYQATIFTFEDSAKVILDAGSYLYLPVCGNWSGAGVKFRPEQANWECLTINEGAYAYVFNDYGSSSKAVVSMNGGAWEMRYRSWWNGNRHQIAFKGIKNVSIPANKVCLIRRTQGTGAQSGSTHYDGNDLTSAVDSVTKFTGSGDLCVTNGYKGKTFAAVVQSSGNTCTGNAYGDLASKSTLLFNNGSDWAGKVIFDGSVAVVNGALNNNYFAVSDAAAEVTFGSVDLKTDFPIRVFGTYDEDLKRVTITGNDKVNITGAEGWIDNGGQIVVQFPETFTANELPVNARIPLGTIPVTAQLPKVRRADHLVVYTQTIEGDEEHVNYGLKPNRGFIIIFR